MPLSGFHPAVSQWFSDHFPGATAVQQQAWPSIQARQHTLLAAPTGSGKTLAGFLASINELVEHSRHAPLEYQTRILYVSPLKALSNDVEKNLRLPLAGINDALLALNQPPAPITAAVRTGDTPAYERSKMLKKPPHILVTTPESLYILLTSEGGRGILKTVETVVIDEIHAMAGDKRGAHLSLSMERLQALVEQPLLRVGMSATQEPIEAMASFLVGHRPEACNIIDTGHVRDRDLAIELTSSPLEAVMSNEVWGEIYDRLATFSQHHRTTLIFTNTRRMSERVAKHLADRIGNEHVTSHHGSLSKEHRLEAEQRLKSGQLSALVATASLELGIDIGDVDLVCQLGSPRSIAGFLQRVGRSGHAVLATPKGRLFPLTRDDLMESVALLQAIESGELDRIHQPIAPLDVLSQQIIAEVAAREWEEPALLQQFRQAAPYGQLGDEQWHAVLKMVAEGYTTRRGRRGAFLHWDTVNKRLRPRRAARLTAMTNAGTIPDLFDYDVIMEPQGISVGTLNEDFAFESLPGDIFQLGNTSYRVLKVESGRMFVEDAQGLPPTIPFWFGESPGRSDELSSAVSKLRGQINSQLEFGQEHSRDWLEKHTPCDALAAGQLSDYLSNTHAALGLIPDQTNIVFERFFDEAGDMHLVIHSPYGSRLNRAWGLALRKRFCRRFNFELQAAALEDSIVLSLGATHSFPLEEVADYLHPDSVRDVLIQALLDAPMFETHWRWNACTALAIIRYRNGKRVPAAFQRADAEDLVALVFPDQLACLENISGAREIPDHPLVQQTVDDCLTQLMDIEGLQKLLARIRSGEVVIHCRDLSGPSPLSREIINARPYAFLDPAPAEERRTLAISQLEMPHPEDSARLGRLSPEAIARVREEAWPLVRDADELHDALQVYSFLSQQEASRIPDIQRLLDELNQQGRLFELQPPGRVPLWIAIERREEFAALYPGPLQNGQTSSDTDPEALTEIIRGRMELLGPTSLAALEAPLGCGHSSVEQALLALEQEGFVMRGQFSGEHNIEWCERRLLARIHRYSLERLRKQIKPVSAANYMSFLFRWHGLHDPGEGTDALARTLEQLEGICAPASAWEREILPARIRGYSADALDQLCSRGRILWLHPRHSHNLTTGPVSNTPISLLQRQTSTYWLQSHVTDPEQLSSPSRKVYEQLQISGAAFFFDLVSASRMLRTQVENALGELVSAGLVTADNFIGLRALITPSQKRPSFSARRRHSRSSVWSVDDAGRWSLVTPGAENPEGEGLEEQEAYLYHIAWTLLHRYGVVFRKVLERERGLPPWRDLQRVYRRLEARGEIRGGRFVDGFSGEQFALPEAVGALRQKTPDDRPYQIINACDPLNLTGIITLGEHVPRRKTSRILYQQGVPVALMQNGELKVLQPSQSTSANEFSAQFRPTQQYGSSQL